MIRKYQVATSGGATSPPTSLLDLAPMTDWTEEEFDAIAALPVGDSVTFEADRISVRRVE